MIQYISIRYGGTNLSGDTFLAGLVLAGCGSKTIVNHIESLNSPNNSFQFLGGTVNCRYLAGVFCFSGIYIEGYRGKLQNIFTIKKQSQYLDLIYTMNHYSPWFMDSEPKINFVIYNATLLGNNFISGKDYDIDKAISLRHSTQGILKNSMIVETQLVPIYIDEYSMDEINSEALSITNNLWWLNEDYPVFDSMKVQENIIPYLNDNNNVIVDPQLYGISRTNDGGLDPRPRPESPAWTMELADYPDDGFFEPVNYAGAFGTENWLEGWSWLWQMGYFDTTSTSIESPPESIPADYRLDQNYPNPFNPSTAIKYSVPVVDANFAPTTHVILKVFDMLGREVATLVNKYQSAGTYEVKFDGSNLSSGIYFYTLKSGSYTKTYKMVLLK